MIVVVRNQISALQSLYCYAMAQPDGGFKSFDAWLRDLSSISSRGRGLELFKYADLVSTYAALFGKERVKVLFYEDMAKNYQAFAEQFATILGAHPARFAAIPVERHNIRPSTRKLRALDFARRFPWIPRLVDRLPARVATKLLAFIERGASLDVSYTEANERFVRAYYAANNRALAAWLDEDLAPRKYPLDPIESSRAPGNCP